MSYLLSYLNLTIVRILQIRPPSQIMPYPSGTGTDMRHRHLWGQLRHRYRQLCRERRAIGYGRGHYFPDGYLYGIQPVRGRRSGFCSKPCSRYTTGIAITSITAGSMGCALLPATLCDVAVGRCRLADVFGGDVCRCQSRCRRWSLTHK